MVVNYRGRPLSTWVGMFFTGAVGGGLALTALVLLALGKRPVTVPRLLWVALGCVGVGLAGLFDDAQPNRTRGVARQLRLLVAGRVTSGVVKLGAITAIAAGVAWALDARGARFILAVLVLAGCANLWNLLDVVPGRCLKLFFPAAAGLAVASGGLVFRVLAIAAGLAGIIALRFDLQERAMLGDAGSNVVGFVVGIEALGSLTLAGLWAVLGVVVALHVLSETMTLSRAIAAVPALRSFDGLGRVRDPQRQDSTST